MSFRVGKVDSKLLVLAILLGVTACSRMVPQPIIKHEAAANATGTITLDILQASPSTYWHYTIHPSDGTITEVSKQKFADGLHASIPETFARPAGEITACRDHPTAESPNRSFVATCVEIVHKVDQFSVAYSYSFVVDDRSTQSELLNWTVSKSRLIRGFAWSPDSKSVAVLTLDEYYGRRPWERLSAMSGHPVPHHTVYVDVFDVDGWKRTEYMVRDEVINAYTRILSWQQ